MLCNIKLKDKIMKKEKTRAVQLRLPEPMYQEVKGIAQKQYRSINGLLLYWLENVVLPKEKENSKSQIPTIKNSK